MEEIDLSVSNAEEENIVGTITYYTGECLTFFSEQKMLDEYKDILYSVGPNGIESHIVYPKDKNKERYGLKYELESEIYGIYGFDYTKEEYLKDLSEKKEDLSR